MQFDTFLRDHAFMKRQTPPVLWEADADQARLNALVDAVLEAASSRGAAVSDLTLNLSNVVVDAPEEGDEPGNGPEPGDYVAVTIGGHVDLGPDDRWTPARPPSAALLSSLAVRLTDASVRFAYVRRLPPDGSVTMFLPALGAP